MASSMHAEACDHRKGVILHRDSTTVGLLDRYNAPAPRSILLRDGNGVLRRTLRGSYRAGGRFHGVRSHGPSERPHLAIAYPAIGPTVALSAYPSPTHTQTEGPEERHCRLAKAHSSLAKRATPMQRWTPCGIEALQGTRRRQGLERASQLRREARALGPRSAPWSQTQGAVTFLVHRLEGPRVTCLFLEGRGLTDMGPCLSGQCAGMTRGSSIWHRLGRTLRRRASSIS